MSDLSNAVRGGRVIHDADCSDRTLAGVLIRLARAGHVQVTCRTCSPRFQADVATVPVIPATSRYRCPVHPDEPVRRNARGYAVGCPQCAPKRRPKRASVDSFDATTEGLPHE